MTELLTAAQMRAIETAAIESGEVTGLELMERAGRGVVEAMLEWRPELATAPHRAVVLCGPGNNGGDGFVVARLLKERGWEVEVFLYGDEAKLPPDAAENCRRWREMGEIAPLDGDEAFVSRAGRVDVVIDALFGTGLTRGLPNEVESGVAFLGCYEPSQRGEVYVAVDIPSGLCSDSGRLFAQDGAMLPTVTGFNVPTVTGFNSDLTVTFHKRKLGHVLGLGPSYCSEVCVVDIGLAEVSIRRLADVAADCLSPPVPAPEDDSVDESQPRTRDIVVLADSDETPDDREGIERAEEGMQRPVALLDPSMMHVAKLARSHKYHHGHALILSGGVGKGGAARLAAWGALRIGAGLVTVGCPPAALQENAARLDAVMLASVGNRDELGEELAARKIRAVCIGPGFGTGERLRAFLGTVLSAGDGARDGGVEPHPTGDGPEPSDAKDRPAVVLDADALTEFREDPETLFAMLHDRCVLTPHEGEFGRLFPDILAKLKAPASRGPAYSKVDAAREAAARAGCVVLFKGADTVIAHPSGRCSINSAHYERAAPWLATAGSGDVLTGFITGLLARGLGPMAAAETAAWLHVECARKFGPGLIAEDLPEQLPAVFRDLGI